MRLAPSTWAIVVGINDYPHDQWLGSLTGAVADAEAACRWLLELGVPGGQILLHCSPCTRTDDDLPEPHRATKRAFLQSLNRFRTGEARGERLYVFLFGHAIYEVEDQACFLFEDFGEAGTMTNIGIEPLTKFMRSFSIPQQFLIMDGCQNLPYDGSRRRQIEAGRWDGRIDFTTNPKVALTRCLSASVGERAYEDKIAKRGVFSKHLFEAISLAAPAAEGVHLDFENGDRLVDLEALVEDKLRRLVDEEAKRCGRSQTPHVVGAEGPIQPPLMTVVTPADKLAHISLDVLPPEAVDAIQSITMFDPKAPGSQLRRPQHPDQTLDLPIVASTPANTSIVVTAQLAPDVDWSPPPTRARTVRAGKQRIALKYHRKRAPGRRPAASPRDLDQELFTAFPLEHRYRSAADMDVDAGPRRVVVEDGFEVSFEDQHGAAKLAGPLWDAAMVWIKALDGTVLQQISPHQLMLPEWIPAAGEPITISLDLPWGRWAKLLVPGVDIGVLLPSRVGRPPVRVRLPIRPPNPSLVAHTPPGTKVRLRHGLFGAPQTEPWTAAEGRDPLVVDLVSLEWPRTLVELRWNEQTVCTTPPLRASLGLWVEEGTVDAAPLSSIPLPVWDTAISLGSLAGGPDPILAAALSLQPLTPERSLLALAGAYAAEAHHDPERGRAALEALAGENAPYRHGLDVAALAGVHDAAEPERLVKRLLWAAVNGEVPVLRWGTAIVGQAVRQLGSAELSWLLEPWLDALAQVERTASLLSAWTTWIEDAAFKDHLLRLEQDRRRRWQGRLRELRPDASAAQLRRWAQGGTGGVEALTRAVTG